jgi:LPXTG-motif cell wall-anchored protein
VNTVDALRSWLARPDETVLFALVGFVVVMAIAGVFASRRGRAQGSAGRE